MFKENCFDFNEIKSFWWRRFFKNFYFMSGECLFRFNIFEVGMIFYMGNVRIVIFVYYFKVIFDMCNF